MAGKLDANDPGYIDIFLLYHEELREFLEMNGMWEPPDRRQHYTTWIKPLCGFLIYGDVVTDDEGVPQLAKNGVELKVRPRIRLRVGRVPDWWPA
jgi:hypothetical protein